MTILDTYYLLFKTDVSGAAKKDISDLDKQIDVLTAKGKKRDEQENIALKNLQKQRKEVTGELKEQQKALDGIGLSFTKMVEGGVAALTAFAGFTAIKNGIKDAANLNSRLEVQAKNAGQSAGELREWSTAVEAAGGSAEGFLGSIDAMTRAAADAVIPLTDITRLIKTYHDLVAGLPKQEQRRRLGLLGINDPGFIGLLEQSSEEFAKNTEEIKKHAEATQAATKPAREFEEQWSKTTQAFTDAYSVLDTHLLPHLTFLLKLMEGLGHVLADLDHPIDNFTGWASHQIDRFKALPKAGFSSSASELDAYIAAHPEEFPNSAPSTSASGSSPPSGNSASGSTLGIRSNNPGNLQPGGREAIFATPEQGLSALAKQLRRYGSRGINTISGIISTYAPPSANNTAAYIAAVAQATGFGVNQQLNLNDPNVLQKLSNAIIQHENGSNPYSQQQIQQSISTATGFSLNASPAGGTGVGAGGNSVSVKTGDINVQTQATDAGGIASAISAELQNQIRTAMSNFDDGVYA